MNLSISKYCSLSDHKFLVNGKKIYENSDIKSSPEFLSTLYRVMEIGYPKFFKMDNLSKLGYLCTELLLRETSLFGESPKMDVGMVFCNKSSSLDTDENFVKTIGEDYFPSPSVFVYTLPNIVMGEIAIRHKIHGENTFFVCDKFNPELLFNYTHSCFEEEIISQAIIGWIEFHSNTSKAFLMLVNKEESEKQMFDVKTINDLYVQI
jgi:hypothetical protein